MHDVDEALALAEEAIAVGKEATSLAASFRQIAVAAQLHLASDCDGTDGTKTRDALQAELLRHSNTFE